MRRLTVSPLAITIMVPFLATKISSSSGLDEERSTSCRIQSTPQGKRNPPGLADCVGKTPLIYLPRLSAVTGCRIYGKCEYMNPTGSVKDRAASFMLEEAERSGQLLPGGIIVEGTGGNTGISLAQIGRAKGYHVILCMPHNIAKEKIELMKRLGAEVHLQPSVPFTDPRHYAQLAASLAKERGGFHTNQFENMSNYRAHVGGTGPEVWEQSHHSLDLFVTSAGTGGTLAGVSSYLKQVNPQVRCYLADPHGSSLFHYVLSNGQSLETVGKGTIMEGIGINRITENFKQAKLDGAVTVSDEEAVNMAHYLLRHEGLSVGPSAALNVAAATKLALRNRHSGLAIVTILCDGGERNASKLYSSDYLAAQGLTPKAPLPDPSEDLLQFLSPENT